MTNTIDRRWIFVAVILLQVAVGWSAFTQLMRRSEGALDSELQLQLQVLGEMTEADTNGAPEPARTVVAPFAGFQYWAPDGRMRFSSPAFQAIGRDAFAPGFSRARIGGEEWRILTRADDGALMRVGQRRGFVALQRRTALLVAGALVLLGIPLVVLSGRRAK